MAEETIEKLDVEIAADVSEYDKGLDEAERRTDGFVSSLSGKLGGMGTLFGGLGTAALAGFGAAGLAGFDLASDIEGATARMQSQLGVTGEEAEALGGVITSIYGQNLGGSIDEVSAAVATVNQQMGLLPQEELEGATANALKIADTFGVDVAQSTNAANALMQEFGISSDEAFDLITYGFQNGLNNSGDFLESIGEYSNQLGEAGYSAEEFVSIMETGMGSGILGTDKIADAVKEANIRIKELNDDVIQAFDDIGSASYGKDLAAQLGVADAAFIDIEENAEEVAAYFRNEFGLDIDPEELAAPLMIVDEKTGELIEGSRTFGSVFSSEIARAVEEGTLSVADAQQLMINGLGEMDNEIHANAAGVAIFGTQWEDMTANGILGMDAMAVSMDDMAGATDSLDAQYQTFGHMMGGIWRSIQTEALMPVGQELLKIGNAILPQLQGAFSWFGDVLPGIVQGITPIFSATFEAISGFISEHGSTILDIFTTTWDTIQAIITPIIGFISGVVTTAFGFINDFMAEHGMAILADIQATWERVQAIIMPAVAWIQETVTAVFEGVQLFLAEHGDEIMATLRGAWDTIMMVVDLALTAIEMTIVPAFQWIAGFISDHGDEIYQILAGAWEIIKGVIDTVIGVIQGIIDVAMGILTGDWGRAWDAIKGIVETVWDGIKDVVSGALDVLGGVLTIAWDAITLAVSAVWGGIKDLIVGAFEGALSAIKGPINAMIGFVNELIDGVNAVGTTLGFDAIPTIPQLAAGTASWGGGLAIAGEKGPELMFAGGNASLLTGGVYDLPRGARVLPADTTAGMLAGGGGQAISINQTFPIGANAADVQLAARRGAEEALREMGVRADIRQKTGR